LNNKNRDNRLIFLLVAFLALMNGCGGGPPKDIVLEGELIASESINPNREGRPSPVTVVILHLKGADAFLTQDFFNLYNADSGVLGADLIQRTDMQIQPGQTLSIGSEFDPETTHVGVLAAFRDIDSAGWRALVALPEKSLKEKINPFSKQKLIISVDELQVTAEVTKQ
jgi:type VI secretion system protein VasD